MLETTSESTSPTRQTRLTLLQDPEPPHSLVRLTESYSIQPDGSLERIHFEAVVGDHVLLNIKNPEASAALPAILQKHGLTLRPLSPHSTVQVVVTSEHTLAALPKTLAALEPLAALGAHIESDALAFPQLVPDDPKWSSLYGMVKIGAPAAWDITTGNPEVVLAMVDTGTRVTHEDLKNTQWINPGEIPGNGIDDDNNGFIDDINGWNVETDTAELDGNGIQYLNYPASETSADANPDGDNTATLIQIRVKHDPTTQPKRFLRLQVTQ